ncbi:NAD(P)H dehydrogenase [Lottiidibacillus patelloidae]|uniref:NAD(P)H dehydrogenase n=1 Tax=Lottiidibacillus patelloidae TaxID=2670334 RepID=A0A263BRN2_9BACI|nr:flavodoxin family protein [Lottiidibacillus patelloidae]OZM56354.1 NAD(P)H dehydrogenase [Lottiidibacillus patelloidae]
MAVINGSSRENGNTENLTNKVITDIEFTNFVLRDYSIQTIVDQRHTETGFQPVNDDYDQLIEAILNHDIIIFSTPIYWYGMSSLMKTFVDRFSQSLRNTKYNFKELMQQKTFYVITCGGDKARIKGMPLIQQFSYICQFFGAELNDYIIGEANAPGDIERDEYALMKAKQWNQFFKRNINQNQINRN